MVQRASFQFLFRRRSLSHFLRGFASLLSGVGDLVEESVHPLGEEELMENKASLSLTSRAC